MSREKELFRDNLVRLDEAFPGRELIKFAAAAEYCGVPTRTAREDKKFPKQLVGKNLYVSKTKLASYLA